MSPQIPPGEAHITYSMAAALLLGGGMGYYKKKSIPSLAAGVTFAIGYGVAGYMISKGDPKLGHNIGFGLSSVLAAVMGLRAARATKFMPAGAVASLGAISAAYELKKSMDWA